MEKMNRRKSIEALNKQDKGIDVAREKLKCGCDHKRKNELDITPKQNRQQGELTYICNECTKDLNLKKIPMDKLHEACDIVDRACDVIKISADPQKEVDEEIIKRVGKVQYRVRNEIQKLYAAALKKNGQGNNNKKDRNNDGGGWDKPEFR